MQLFGVGTPPHVGWLPMTPTKAKAPAPRIVSVWFPMLTMERWRRVIAQYRSVPGDEVPVVLSRDGTHGPVVYGLSAAATMRGIEAGAATGNEGIEVGVDRQRQRPAIA